MSGKRKGRGGCGCGLFLLICVLIIAGGVIWLGVMRGAHLTSALFDHTEEAAADIPYQEVTIMEESLAGKYYYQRLSDEDKTVYKEIVQGIKEFSEEIYIHTGDAEHANQIFRYVLYDMPEVFWCDGQAASTTYKDEYENMYTTIQVNYTYDREKTEELKGRIQTAVNECLAGMADDSSEYEKIKYVYEYVINTVEYDIEAPDNQNICSVFIGRRSVCAGYARATQYLLESVGVFATYVSGTSVNEQNAEAIDHAWNLVRCDGEYYYVDATWGDPVFTQQEDTPDLTQEEMINYDYLCCNDEELFKTHTLSADVTMPACTSDQYNYYAMHGMYYEENNPEVFQESMNRSISQKERMVIFKFSSAELYQQAKGETLGDMVESSAQYLMSLYGLSRVSYYYQEEVQLNKLVIYWSYN